MFDPRYRRRPRPRKNPAPDNHHFSLPTKPLLIILSWLPLVLLVLFVNPEFVADIPPSNTFTPFFSLLFIAIFVTAKFITRHLRRGLLIAAAVVFYLYLRLLGIGYSYNLILLISLLIALEIYLSTPNQPPSSPDKNL